MTVYSKPDLAEIAATIGKPLATVELFASRLEAAAFFYQRDGRFEVLPQPAKKRDRMRRIEKSARRLLKDLGVDDPSKAMDGPPHDVPEILAYAGSERTRSSRQRGGSEGWQKILAAVQAAHELEGFAKQAAGEIGRMGQLLVPKGHQGDAVKSVSSHHVTGQGKPEPPELM